MILDPAQYRQHSRTLPYPIADGMGRIARADTLVAQLDWLVKTAERLTRYVALAAHSSFCTRNRDAEPEARIDLERSLSWGRFYDLARTTADKNTEHPLRGVLAKGLRPHDQQAGASTLGGFDCLEALLKYRNKCTAHSLVGMDTVKAEADLEKYQLEQKLLAAVDAFEPLLRLPLFVVSQMSREHKRNMARLLPYVGESEPFPLHIEVAGHVHNNVPYLAKGRELICLKPGIIWRPAQPSHRPTFYCIDSVDDAKVKYRALSFDDDVTSESKTSEVDQWIACRHEIVDTLTSEDGTSIAEVIRDALAFDRERDHLSKPVGDTQSDTVGSVATKNDGISEPVEPLMAVAAREASQLRFEGSGEHYDSLLARAGLSGLGENLRALVDVVSRNEWLLRTYRDGVEVLATAWRGYGLIWIKLIEGDDPQLSVSLRHRNFLEFYDVPLERVRDGLGPSRCYSPGDTCADLVESLGQLGRDLRGSRLAR